MKTHSLLFCHQFPLDNDHDNVECHTWVLQLEGIPAGILFFSKGQFQWILRSSTNTVLSWLPHLAINVNGAAKQLETWPYICGVISSIHDFKALHLHQLNWTLLHSKSPSWIFSFQVILSIRTFFAAINGCQLKYPYLGWFSWEIFSPLW